MDRSQRLPHVFVELADTLVDDFDVVEFLEMLTERCVELLAVDAAGLMLADPRRRPQLIASTAAESRLLELFELQVAQGPCLDCFSTGEAVVNVSVVDAERRWPSFALAGAEVGFASTHALPMRLRHQVIGALNLFTVRPSELGTEDLAIGQAMADVATIGLMHERTLREQTILAEQLQTALHTRVVVEQAKGVLAAHTGVSVDEAFTLLRTHARSRRRRLAEVAAALVDGSLGVGELANS